MIDAPNMLLIGAAGRDAGKTVFACKLIGRFRQVSQLAAKVTTIQEQGGACPRGGAGCGVCSSLEGDYCITQETTAMGSKDTQRLLNAGASRVLWLRVLKASLAEGAQALLEQLDKAAPIICESNSLRHVVRPGLFVMLQHRDRDVVKASAREVRDYADAIIYTDGHIFDFDFDRVTFVNNRWVLR